jgi:DNA mismatch repair protein MutS2
VKFLAQIDFIQAKAQLAEQFDAFEPEVLPFPHIDWIRAIHPLLQESLLRQGKNVVPLDIELSSERDSSKVQGVQEDSYRSTAGAFRSGKATYRSEAYRSEPGSRIVPVSKVLNGAMLYDRHEMKALFQLQTGRPGSSFAIEIARKTGLPEEVIKDASDIVGQDYIQSDKYLQDIVRDKRYWERKRETVHQREKDIEKTITRYESSVEEIEKERKAILRRAKEQAEELLREANRRIEHTIREIREAEAEREATRRLREDLNDFKSEVQTIDSTQTDAAIEKKMQQIIARKERQAKRKAEKKDSPLTPLLNRGEQNAPAKSDSNSSPLSKRGAGGESKLSPKLAALLDHWQGGGEVKKDERLNNAKQDSKMTRHVIDEHKQNYRQEIDVRGLRGDEALLEVQHFIDDAILIGSHTVRILHGKGNGILRELIRNYLNALPNVIGCRDEHIQFGGSGITVVDLG